MAATTSRVLPAPVCAAVEEHEYDEDGDYNEDDHENEHDDGTAASISLRRVPCGAVVCQLRKTVSYRSVYARTPVYTAQSNA
jgi:hypothetical protein